MELIGYWRIIRKRLWIVALLLLVVGGSYAVTKPTTTSTYSAGMRFVVGLVPEPGAGEYYTYDRYYTWLTAEYLIDDLSEVVKSSAFATDVAQLAGLPIPPSAIQGATYSGKLHRILSVSLVWPDAEELTLLSNAIIQVLTSQPNKYFAQLGTETAIATLIDVPVVLPVGEPLRQRLDLPLRLLLALGAGIALTFVFDYVDPTVRDGHDLSLVGLPILAEIPKRQRRVDHLLRRPHK